MAGSDQQGVSSFGVMSGVMILEKCQLVPGLWMTEKLRIWYWYVFSYFYCMCSNKDPGSIPTPDQGSFFMTRGNDASTEIDFSVESDKSLVYKQFNIEY